MPTTNIDDLLMGGKTHTQPESPENQYEDAPSEIEEIEPDLPQSDYDDEQEDERPSHDDDSEHAEGDESSEKQSHETDEYGNTKEPENPVIRERLKKQAESMSRKHEAEINALRAQLAAQNAAPSVQQAAKDFEYDPNASGDWQQQLASFVKQTVKSMNDEQVQAQQRQIEQEAHQEFEAKFTQGMENFNDFREVVSEQPIDDYMTMALRGMNDPAAFIYAASKRHPQELQRISKLRDPYARMVEMGKLEERMRRNKPATKAPRPLSRTNEDGQMPQSKKKDKDSSIEDLIAKSDAKRMAQMKNRRGR